MNGVVPEDSGSNLRYPWLTNLLTTRTIHLIIYKIYNKYKLHHGWSGSTLHVEKEPVISLLELQYKKIESEIIKRRTLGSRGTGQRGTI